MALREILASFGIEADTAPLEQMDEGLNGVIAGMQQFAAVLAGGAVINELRAFLEEMSIAGDELDKTSIRLQISTEELQTWRHAAALSGVGAGEFTAALSALQRNALAAAEGSTEMASNFRDMGVEVRNADGSLRTTDEVLLGIADGIGSIPDPTRRAALAMRLMGRSGAQLLPLFNQGAAGVAAMRAEVERLGGGASPEFIANSVATRDALQRVDVAVFSLRTRVANLFLPALARASEGMANLVAGFTRAIDKSHALEAVVLIVSSVMVAAGLTVTAAWAGPLATFAAVTLAVAFIILLVDDLITLFSGGTSVIGTFLDELLGVGTAAQVVLYLTDAWHGLTMAVGEAADAVAAFFGDVNDEIAGSIVGEDITRTRGFDPATAISAEEADARRFARTNALDVAVAGALPSGVGSLPAPTGGARGGAVINSPVTVNLPPGVPLGEAERVRRVVDATLDARNREAAAALAVEADPS